MHSDEDVSTALAETTRDKLEKLAQERYGCSFRALDGFSRHRLEMMLDIIETAERAPKEAEARERDTRAIADERVALAFAEGSWGFEFLANILVEVGKETRRLINERDAKLEARSAKDESLGAAALKLVNAMDTRMKRCENQLMPMANSPFNTTAEVKQLKAFIEKQQETIASLERRVSRHADHLARIEDWKKTR